ncbi:MAG: hypothetical protein J6M64_03375 [Oscillospiraceae bacterium]|nr:hypothetical protein [Oscillospiraceae bacterium]
MDPDGNRCTIDEFRSNFPHSCLCGDTTDTLIINNVTAEMNGYRFFCTFSKDEGAESSKEAELHIINRNGPQIPKDILEDAIEGIDIDPVFEPYFEALLG